MSTFLQMKSHADFFFCIHVCYDCYPSSSLLSPMHLQYFPKRSTVFAHDPEEAAKLGDVVLVKELPIRKSKHVKYEMERIIYSLGNVTDPITGKRCDCYSYWDDDLETAPSESSVDESSAKETSRTISEGMETLEKDGTPV